MTRRAAKIKLWNRRHRGAAAADETFVVPEAPDAGHDGVDALLVAEFLRFVRDGGPTETSPVAAREAVAAGVLATESLRGDGSARAIPPLDPQLVAYFERGQVQDDRGMGTPDQENIILSSARAH